MFPAGIVKFAVGTNYLCDTRKQGRRRIVLLSGSSSARLRAMTTMIDNVKKKG
jgi:hypothetical protein